MLSVREQNQEWSKGKWSAAVVPTDPGRTSARLRHEPLRDRDDPVRLAPQPEVVQRIQGRPNRRGHVSVGNRLTCHPLRGEIEDRVVEPHPPVSSRRMCRTVAAKCSVPTTMPDSSSSSRRAASSAGLAEFLRAAGQRPGADIRRLAAATQQDVSPLMTTIPIPTIGRVGYSRSLISVRRRLGWHQGVATAPPQPLGRIRTAFGCCRLQVVHRRHQRLLLPGADLIRPAAQSAFSLSASAFALSDVPATGSAPRHPCRR